MEMLRNVLWVLAGILTLVGAIYGILYLKLKDDFDKRYIKKEECTVKMGAQQKDHDGFKQYIKEDINELKTDMKTGFSSLGGKVDKLVQAVAQRAN